MKKKNKSYPEELKREALKLASNPDVSVAQAERDLGITSGVSGTAWMKRQMN